MSNTCPGSGQPLPEDARADYEADSTCTHFYCAHCTKLLRLPATPDGTVRRHTPATPTWAQVLAAEEQQQSNNQE